MKQILISESEWAIMKLLWEKSPNTLGEMTRSLADEKGWTRATVFVMLKRLIAKGAVRVDESERIHRYFPAVERGDLALAETESFLNRVYDGSVKMLFASLTGRKPLSREEIDELRQILDEAERK